MQLRAPAEAQDKHEEELAQLEQWHTFSVTLRRPSFEELTIEQQRDTRLSIHVSPSSRPGFGFQTIDDGEVASLTVTRVQPSSPASLAGLRGGDVIVKASLRESIGSVQHMRSDEISARRAMVHELKLARCSSTGHDASNLLLSPDATLHHFITHGGLERSSDSFIDLLEFGQLYCEHCTTHGFQVPTAFGRRGGGCYHNAMVLEQSFYQAAFERLGLHVAVVRDLKKAEQLQLRLAHECDMQVLADDVSRQLETLEGLITSVEDEELPVLKQRAAALANVAQSFDPSTTGGYPLEGWCMYVGSVDHPEEEAPLYKACELVAQLDSSADKRRYGVLRHAELCPQWTTYANLPQLYEAVRAKQKQRTELHEQHVKLDEKELDLKVLYKRLAQVQESAAHKKAAVYGKYAEARSQLEHSLKDYTLRVVGVGHTELNARDADCSIEAERALEAWRPGGSLQLDLQVERPAALGKAILQHRYGCCLSLLRPCREDGPWLSVLDAVFAAHLAYGAAGLGSRWVYVGDAAPTGGREQAHLPAKLAALLKAALPADDVELSRPDLAPLVAELRALELQPGDFVKVGTSYYRPAAARFDGTAETASVDVLTGLMSHLPGGSQLRWMMGRPVPADLASCFQEDDGGGLRAVHLAELSVQDDSLPRALERLGLKHAAPRLHDELHAGKHGPWRATQQQWRDVLTAAVGGSALTGGGGASRASRTAASREALQVRTSFHLDRLAAALQEVAPPACPLLLVLFGVAHEPTRTALLDAFLAALEAVPEDQCPRVGLTPLHLLAALGDHDLTTAMAAALPPSYLRLETTFTRSTPLSICASTGSECRALSWRSLPDPCSTLAVRR